MMSYKMVEVGKLYENLGFTLYYLSAKAGNLDIDLEGY
jgi:hypothetical protein